MTAGGAIFSNKLRHRRRPLLGRGGARQLRRRRAHQRGERVGGVEHEGRLRPPRLGTCLHRDRRLSCGRARNQAAGAEAMGVAAERARKARPLSSGPPRRHSRAALCTAEPCPSLTMRQCGRALGLLAGQRGLLDLGGGTTPLGARRGNCDSGADTQQMAKHVCSSERRAPCGFGFAGALPKMTFS